MMLFVIATVLIAGCSSTTPDTIPPSPTPVVVSSTPTTLPPPQQQGQSTEGSSQSPDKPAFESYVASGYMGDIEDIHMNSVFTGISHSEPTSIQVVYDAKNDGSNQWSGVYWLSPPNNWGNLADGLNLSGYNRLTFWVRGDKGDEKVEFKVGGIAKKPEYKYFDSISPQDAPTTHVITLSKDWTKREIPLNNKDLSHVLGGFSWVATRTNNPKGATFYLDDIKFE